MVDGTGEDMDDSTGQDIDKSKGKSGDDGGSSKIEARLEAQLKPCCNLAAQVIRADDCIPARHLPVLVLPVVKLCVAPSR